MRATISRAEVTLFARSLGADPSQTKAVHLQHDAVAVEVYKLDENGNRYVEPGPNGMQATPGWEPEPATETTVIKIVGDGDAEKVRLRHPNLPGQEIEVRAAGVGQRAMAGWEVVNPGGENPEADGSGTPPPDPAVIADGEQSEPDPQGGNTPSTPRGRRKASKEDD